MQICSDSIFESYHLTFRLDAYAMKVSLTICQNMWQEKKEVLVWRKKGHWLWDPLIWEPQTKETIHERKFTVMLLGNLFQEKRGRYYYVCYITG